MNKKNNNDSKTGDYWLKFSPEIYGNKDLTANEMLYLMLAASLDGDRNCFARSKFFEEKMHVSSSTVTRIAAKLRKRNIISNVKNTGRGVVREVKPTLKIKRSDSSKISMTKLKDTRLTSQIDESIYKEKKNKEIKEKDISPKTNELDVSSSLLKIGMRNSEQIFQQCVIIYEREHKIIWEREQEEALTTLCNLIHKHYGDNFSDLTLAKRNAIYIEIFTSTIQISPSWFTDRLPSTYVRFSNKVFQEPKLTEKVKKVLSRYTRTSEF